MVSTNPTVPESLRATIRHFSDDGWTQDEVLHVVSKAKDHDVAHMLVDVVETEVGRPLMKKFFKTYNNWAGTALRNGSNMPGSVVSCVSDEQRAGEHRFDGANRLGNTFHLVRFVGRMNRDNRVRLIPKRVDFTGAPLFFGAKNEILTEHACQGRLHDCYFFAALRTLARKEPETIRNAIRYNEADGTYSVRFFEQDGTEEWVHHIEPHFDPTWGGIHKDKNGKPLAIWAAVMQEAWLRWRGGGDPERIEYRVAMTPLQAISGRKARQRLTYPYIPFDMPGMGNILERTMEAGLPATIITQPFVSEKHTGLARSHTYEVVDIKRDSNGKVYRDQKGDRVFILTENHDNHIVEVSERTLARHVITYEWFEAE